MLKVVISVNLSNYYIEKIDVQNILPEISLESILSTISSELGIPIIDIKSKSREGEIPDARKYYCAIAREYTDYSLRKIGKLINYDHADVIYSSKRGWFFIKHEVSFRNTYNSIRKRLNLI